MGRDFCLCKFFGVERMEKYKSSITIKKLKSLTDKLQSMVDVEEHDDVTVEFEYGRETFLLSHLEPRLIMEKDNEKKRIVVFITRDI